MECSAGFTLTGDETVSCTDVQGQATLGQLPSCVQRKFLSFLSVCLIDKIKLTISNALFMSIAFT